MNTRIVSYGRATIMGFVALLGSFVTVDRASAQDPDLLAFNAQGPGQAQLDTGVIVNALLLNLGGPLPAEDITLEILLSPDTVVDETDLVIGTKVVNLVGAFTVAAFIPDSLPPGPYNFALRVLPVTGETNLTNNAVIGNQVNIFTTDLCLVGAPTSLTVGAQVDGPSPAPHSLLVGNCAATSGILIFTILEQTPAPWLDVTPSTGFAVAGLAPQSVSLLFNTQGLATGEYSTTLQFVNFGNPNDTEFFTVTLKVDDIVIEPGDLVLGTVDASGEADECVFAGLEGMKIKLKTSSQTGNIRPKVSILKREDRSLVKSWVLKHSAKKITKSTKLPENALYILRIEGDAESVGSYEIGTSMKLPKAARKYKGKIKPVPGTTEGSVTLLGLPGGTLDFAITPKSFTGPLTFTFSPPAGGSLDISSNTQSEPGGGATAADIPLDELGAYTITVDGFGADNEKVKVLISPDQPIGDGAVILP